MHGRRLVYLVLVLSSLALAAGLPGCAKKDGSVGKDSSSAAPPSDAEARAFVGQFTAAAAASDPAALTNLLDMDAVLNAALDGLGFSSGDRRDFGTGVKAGFQKSGGFAGQIQDNVRRGGSLALLRLHIVDGKRRALMRLIFANDEGVNYLDLVLARRSDGSVRAADLYTFMSGEMLSESLRRPAMQVAQSRGLLARLSGAKSDFVKSLPTIGRMTRAVQAGNPGEALRLFDTLPAAVKKDKNVLMIRLAASQASGDAAYEAAMEDIRRYYPNDPAVDLISIDYYTLKKQPARAVEMVDRLDRAVGGDPYLNVLRAGIWMDAKDFASARKAARKAALEMPDFREARWLLLGIALEQKDHAETLRLLTEMEDKFGVAISDPATVPEYAVFARSPQYSRWKARHARRER